MKIIYKNLRKGEIRVSVENLDDLWYLSQIISKGDLIRGKTVRKIKLERGDQRKNAVIKKTVVLFIEVEKLEFSKYSDLIRIAGKIAEEKEDIPKGSYHTIELKINSDVLIKKEKWLNYQLKRIEEASKEPKSKVLIVVFDREEASFALLKKYGYELLSEIEGIVSKKQDKEEKESQLYKQIIKEIKNYIKKYGIESVVIASPAFWKEYLLKEMDGNLKRITTLATCSDTGKKGIEEVLKRDEIKSVLRHERTIKEVSLIEELLKEIAKEKLAAYGLKEVAKAAEYKAIKILLVTADLINKMRQEDKFEELEKIMKNTEAANGEIHIISTEHEAGKKLEGLGGIAAILRYQIT